MQYQVDPTDQTPENSQKPLWIIQKCFFVIFDWSSMSGCIAKLLILSSIKGEVYLYAAKHVHAERFRNAKRVMHETMDYYITIVL